MSKCYLQIRRMWFAVAAVAIFNSMGTAIARPIHSCSNFINKTLVEIKSDKDEDKRGDEASAIADYLHRNSNCLVSAKLVDRIAVLLSDHNDSVRFGAAATLANIGPRAKRAIPALRKALRESDSALSQSSSAILPAQYSGQAIREALRKITGKSVPDYGGQQQR